MGEIVTSRSLKMLEMLDDVRRGKIEEQVKSWVSGLEKIEVLFNKAHNNKKVMDNSEKLRIIAYNIEDYLEMCAVAVDVECMNMSGKSEKKWWMRSLVKRFLPKQDDAGFSVESMVFVIELLSYTFLGTMTEWLNETFPDDGMGSLLSEGEELERRAFDRSRRRSVRWQSRNANGMVEHFVGMDEDVDKLKTLVVEDNPAHRVASIWGIEGLGKTSLAKRVYIHYQVRTHFNAFAWVSLSEQGLTFQLATVLQIMLKQLGGGAVKRSTITASADHEQKKGPRLGPAEEKKTSTAAVSMLEDKKKTSSTRSEQNMIDELHKIQREKKCLIVFDDIFGISQWTEIISSACLLLTEESNTRILLTSCDEIIYPLVYSHQLQLLDEDKGWELLKKYVVRGAPDVGLAPRLGKEIVMKCGYLPSSISRLGRILREKSFDEWHEVNDHVLRYLEEANQSQSNEIWHEQDSSPTNYFHLSYHLKQCFLYLGIFKKDNDADSEDLALLWMAEGIISRSPLQKQEGTIILENIPENNAAPTSQQKQETIMEIAENYVHDLFSRDMLRVQVDELSANRRFTQLFLQKQVRELSLSQGEKEGFSLKVVDFSDVKQPTFDPYILSDGTRRLVIHFKKPVISSPQVRDELKERHDLRSLFFLNSDARECVDIPVKISDFKEFTLLRVLHFVRCKFEGRKLPQGIEKLFNLRYFGVLYCDLEELPPSISNFKNLNVLNVKAHDHAKIRIPNVLSQMKQLKHVNLVPNNIDSQHESNKLKLDGLLDLETLVGFNADIHDLESLSELEKLQLLVAHAYSNESLQETIEFLNNVRGGGTQMQANLVIESKCNFSSSSPEGLAILEEVLMCSNLNSLTFSMVRIHKFPNCGAYASSSLTKIKLTGCKLTEDPMEALGKFPNLQKLGLVHGAFVGKSMVIATGFPNLEYLEFRCLPNLEEWSVCEGAMQRLSTVTVKRCPKLRGIPQELASNNKSSLKNMDIDLAPGALSQRQKQKYANMFAFVESHSRNISEFDPLAQSSSKDSSHSWKNIAVRTGLSLATSRKLARKN